MKLLQFQRYEAIETVFGIPAWLALTDPYSYLITDLNGLFTVSVADRYAGTIEHLGTETVLDEATAKCQEHCDRHMQ